MKNRFGIVQKPPIDLEVQQRKLTQLLAQVNACVNKKINDPQALQGFKNAFRKIQPKNLKGGQLKDYQREALVWMIELAHKKMNGILADDMGLGKTIQTISYLAYLQQQKGISGKHLIICPLTVCNNWQRQIKKWMPNLHVEILWGTEELREQGLKTIVKPRNFDVLITPYHTAVSCCLVFKKIPWQVFVIDEAHKIKNDEAILTESVKQFNSNFKLLLTGTPLSNNLRQLWSLLNFVMPDIFYDRKLFDDIQDGIKGYNGNQNQKFEIQCRIAKKFHGLIRPFIMRRTKKDTDLGLPPKTQHTLYVSMTKLQLKMYRNYLKHKNVYGKKNGAATNSQMTTRKICNHPYLFEGIQQEGLDQYGQHLVQNCGKMIVLDKLLHKLTNQKRKILIFSQFKIQLDILEDYCTMRDYNYLRLDGDSTVEQRQEMMQQFNQDDEYLIPIFMLSTRAGGLGVNLVAASVVIIYDIDWNPQNDSQAMDRAYRIGQKRPVNVYKMVTEHTIEERMLEVQKYKLIWDELVIQKGTIMNIKNQDIFSGLNYEKIANMKKGQIFKIQARKDNHTIDEIIKMGQIKDEKKYEQIKEKVIKQIEQQKTSQNFNANPFQDHELNDNEGDQLLRKFQAQQLGQKKQMSKQEQARNELRNKKSFILNSNIPEYYLIEDMDDYKELLWQLNKKNKQLQNHDTDDAEYENQKTQIQNQIKSLEKQIQKHESKAFMNWEKEQYEQFVDQQRKQVAKDVDNIIKLHSLIPTKKLQEINEYKKRFYSIQAKQNLPKIYKTRNDIIKQQTQNKTKHDKSKFHQFLKHNGAVYSKQKAPIQNLINNMRINSDYQDSKQFMESDYYKNDPGIKLLKQFEGIIEFQIIQEKSVVTQKGLLNRFFKGASTYQQALQNPQANKLIKSPFQTRKQKILAEISKKCYGKGDKSSKNSKAQSTDQAQTSIQI